MATYEAGMTVFWNPNTKSVTCAFRGVTTVLPGEYNDKATGIRAGEHFCIAQGWNETGTAAYTPPSDYLTKLRTNFHLK